MRDLLILIPFVVFGIGIIFFLRSGIVMLRNLDKTSASFREKITYGSHTVAVAVLRIVGSAILLALLGYMIIGRIIEVAARYISQK